MFPRALEAAQAIAALKARAGEAGVPAIYVNDNFGKWRSDFRTLLEHCLKSKGRPIAKLLQPNPEDYFVLKPKHSGFHSTTLDVLLAHLGARTLVLTGVASESEADDRYALEHMAKVLKADTAPSAKIELSNYLSQ